MFWSVKMPPKRLPQSALGQLLGASWCLLGASRVPFGELLAPLVSLSCSKALKSFTKSLPKGSLSTRRKSSKRSPKAPQLSSSHPLATFLWCFPALLLLRCARLTFSAESWNPSAPSSKLNDQSSKLKAEAQRYSWKLSVQSSKLNAEIQNQISAS